MHRGRNLTRTITAAGETFEHLSPYARGAALASPLKRWAPVDLSNERSTMTCASMAEVCIKFEDTPGPLGNRKVDELPAR